MTDKRNNNSAIAKAKAASDGRLLTRAHALERRKLQEHGAAEGLDKYKPSGIRLLKRAEDFLSFKADTLKDIRQFRGGLELIHFGAYLDWARYGLEPTPEVLASLPEAAFDPFLATPEENALRAELAAAAATDSISHVKLEAKPAPPVSDAPPASCEATANIAKFSEVEIGTAEGDFAHPHLGVVLEVASPEDEKHRGQVLVHIERDSSGAAVRTTKWAHADQIRLRAGAELPSVELRVKSAPFDVRSADAFKMGYDPNWPDWVVVWRLDQLSAKARALNDRLYHDFVSRIDNAELRDVAMLNARGQAVLLLLNLQGECGQNAGTQMILDHEEHFCLNYKGMAALSMQIRRMREYRKKTDPDVRDLLDILLVVKEKGLRDRDELARGMNSKLYTEIMTQLPEAGKTKGKAVELIGKIETALRTN